MKSYSEVIRVYSATEIPDIAWGRGGLRFPKRATLGDCQVHELIALAATQVTTPEGVAFVSRAAELLEHLEAQASRQYQAQPVAEVPA